MRSPFLVLLLVATVAHSASAAAGQSVGPELAGVWTLLPAESDSVDGLDADARQKAPRPPRGVRPGGARPAGVPGAFGLPRGFDPQLTRDAIEALRPAPERIAIAVNGDTLTLIVGDAAPYAIVPNGKKVNRPWIDGTDAEVKATLRDRELRIERKLENDLRFTDRYELDLAAGRLIVTTQVDGPMPRRFELRRVYERAS